METVVGNLCSPFLLSQLGNSRPCLLKLRTSAASRVFKRCFAAQQLAALLSVAIPKDDSASASASVPSSNSDNDSSLGLRTLRKLLTVCEVHCSSENKMGGFEMDWKLALLLHPDKNKFAGAEAASKLIGEANRVLTDQAKRSVYDIKCRAQVKTGSSVPSAHPSNGNAFVRKENDTSQSQSPPDTFWRHCPFWCSSRICRQEISKSKRTYKSGYIDFDKLEERAVDYRPKILICGGSSYPREWDYARSTDGDVDVTIVEADDATISLGKAISQILRSGWCKRL
ncbi:hypothetical protein C1H46_017051 [Malus baccata]|uniref:J domain-containing protein n=1 Tax=Malus baccata TaxID=106549 RepID=A0A540MG20_MALBA|nr:hypothetical protein C1H46_017051 [Malus baccata]